MSNFFSFVCFTAVRISRAVPSVKYFTDPGSRFAKHAASLNILALWVCQIQSFVFLSSFGLSQETFMVCLNILFIWQLNETVASKRFGRVCLRIEPLPQNKTAGRNFCMNLISTPQPLKVGT